MPLPDRITVCGLPGALSLIRSVAVRAPVADGVNVTEMLRVPPFAATVAGSVVVAKSVEFAPTNVKLAMFKGAVPGFVTVTTMAALVVFTP